MPKHNFDPYWILVSAVVVVPCTRDIQLYGTEEDGNKSSYILFNILKAYLSVGPNLMLLLFVVYTYLTTFFSSN
jgi:hypothetical protein